MLASLTKTQKGDSKQSGLKMKHVSLNTNPLPSSTDVIIDEISSTDSHILTESQKIKKDKKLKPRVPHYILKKHYAYMDQLVIGVYNRDKQNPTYIDEDQIQVDYSKLDQIFIAKHFNINDLINYFTDDAWLSVQSIYGLRVSSLTCSHCKMLCSNKSVECSDCKQWNHVNCEELDDSFVAADWKCSKCEHTSSIGQ